MGCRWNTVAVFAICSNLAVLDLGSEVCLKLAALHPLMLEHWVSAFVEVIVVDSALALIDTRAVALCCVQMSHRRCREAKHDRAESVTSILRRIDSD